jgi:hypothetical protein
VLGSGLVGVGGGVVVLPLPAHGMAGLLSGTTVYEPCFKAAVAS